MEGGLDQYIGQTPFVEQGGAQFVVIHGEALLFERGHFAALVAALDQDAGVFVRIERGQREFADAREQADGEQFLARLKLFAASEADFVKMLFKALLNLCHVAFKHHLGVVDEGDLVTYLLHTLHIVG